MEKRPLVSVIIIFLNGGTFIQEAINSILAQTYENWELFLVDDGSTDESTATALHYARRYPDKIQYVEHPGHQNRGMSASRNAGLTHARGEYIAFLDADDVWAPRKLEEQVAILQAHSHVAMVYGPGHFWRSWTGTPEDSQRDHIQKYLGASLDSFVPPPTLVETFLRDAGIPSPSGVMVRHTVVKEVGGFEDAFRTNHEDAVFYTKVCLRSPVFIASRVWYKHRIHPNSCSVTTAGTQKYAVDRLTYLRWVENYLLQHGFTDHSTRQVLHEQLWPYLHPTLHRVRSTTQELVRQLKLFLKAVGRQMLPGATQHWLRLQREELRKIS